MATIYHVTSKEEWEAAKEKGYYEAASLPIEGFMHCSEEHQVKGVLGRYFSGKKNLVKLTIDTGKLEHQLQYDVAPSLNEAFPHIYGPLNVDAVTDVVAVGA
ncbi:MAG TPA: DUF952 domain-containing protein [Niastella sp.]|nr:DUF952 domain-containing protein [Niastella sp.]